MIPATSVAGTVSFYPKHRTVVRGLWTNWVRTVAIRPVVTRFGAARETFEGMVQLGKSTACSTPSTRSLTMSTAIVAETHYTPEDLLDMPDGKRLRAGSNGQLVERNMGAESSRVGGRLYSRLEQFCEEHGLGMALPADNGLSVLPPRSRSRPQAGCLVRPPRPFAWGRRPKGWVTIPPDLRRRGRLAQGSGLRAGREAG